MPKLGPRFRNWLWPRDSRAFRVALNMSTGVRGVGAGIIGGGLFSRTDWTGVGGAPGG